MMQDREGRRTNVSTISGLIGKPVRFLGHVLANLTERRFRALWAQTDKNVRREELRFVRKDSAYCCGRTLACSR